MRGGDNVALRIVKRVIRFQIVSIIVLVRMQHVMSKLRSGRMVQMHFTWINATNPKLPAIASSLLLRNELFDLPVLERVVCHLALRHIRTGRLTWKVPSNYQWDLLCCQLLQCDF